MCRRRSSLTEKIYGIDSDHVCTTLVPWHLQVFLFERECVQTEKKGQMITKSRTFNEKWFSKRWDRGLQTSNAELLLGIVNVHEASLSKVISNKSSQTCNHAKVIFAAGKEWRQRGTSQNFEDENDVLRDSEVPRMCRRVVTSCHLLQWVKTPYVHIDRIRTRTIVDSDVETSHTHTTSTLFSCRYLYRVYGFSTTLLPSLKWHPGADSQWCTLQCSGICPFSMLP